MALDQYSLAALINRQMGAHGESLVIVPRYSVGAAYFWSVLGSELKKAKPLPRRVLSPPKKSIAALSDAIRQLEQV